MAQKAFDDHYKTLGVAPSASKEQIQDAHHKLAKELHPDRPTHDEERMKIVNRAYDILKDSKKKESYDATYRIKTARAARAASEAKAKIYADRIRSQGTPKPRPVGHDGSPPPPQMPHTPPSPPRKPPTTPRRPPATTATPKPTRPPAQATPTALSSVARVLSLIGTGLMMTVGVIVGWFLLCLGKRSVGQGDITLLRRIWWCGSG